MVGRHTERGQADVSSFAAQARPSVMPGTLTSLRCAIFNCEYRTQYDYRS